MTTKAQIALAVLVTITLTGCGSQWTASSGAATGAKPTPNLPPTPEATPSGGTRPPPEPELGSIPDVSGGKPVAMPLDRHMTSLSDIKIIDQARDIAATRCMRSLGFTHWRPDTIRTWDPLDYNERQYAQHLDPDVVARTGYPQRPDQPPDTGSQPQSGHEPTKQEMKAFDGTKKATRIQGQLIPESGCSGQAEREIYQPSLPIDPRELLGEAQRLAMGHSRVRRAESAWQACMSRSGLTKYASPFMAPRDERWVDRKPGKPASATEKKTAAADAQCRIDTRFPGIYKAAEIAYQKRFLAGNKKKLQAAVPVFNTWLQNADKIKQRGLD